MECWHRYFPKTNSRKVLSLPHRDEQGTAGDRVSPPLAPLKKWNLTPHVKLLSFDDHRDFTPKDLLQIKEQFLHLEEWKRLIITTEKDAARLKLHPALDETLKPYIYVLPIEIEILQNQQYIFNKTLLAMLGAFKKQQPFWREDAHQPETAIILGTGLGSLAGEITEKYEIRYEEIPNFPVSTVEGHSGKLIFGKLGQKTSWRCRDVSILRAIPWRK